jgi:hypothetical protein
VTGDVALAPARPGDGDLLLVRRQEGEVSLAIRAHGLFDGDQQTSPSLDGT